MQFKKSFTFVSILFFLFSIHTNAQNIKVGWGALNPNEKKMYLITTFGNMEDGLFNVFSSPLTMFKAPHLYIEKYTGNAEKVFTKEIIVPVPANIGEASVFTLNNIMMVKGVIYMFSTFYNKSSDTRYLFVNTISTTGEVNNNLKKLDEVKDVKRFEGTYTTIISDDSTKIGIYNFGSYEKNARQKIMLHVIDLKMNDIWNKVMELPYIDKDCLVKDVKIDNDGNAAFTGRITLKGEEAKGKFDYKYTLFNFNWKDGLVKEFPIDLGDKYMSDFYFTIDKENNIRATGFYAVKGNGYLNGYFYFVEDTKTQTLTTKIVKEFDAKFFAYFPKKTDLLNINTQQLFVAANGSINIIAEQKYSYATTYTNSQGYTTIVYHYVANNVVVINLSKEGNYNWTATIDKKHNFTNSTSGVYSVFMPYGNSIFVAYNDYLGNKDLEDAGKKIKTYATTGKTEMVIAKIDDTGKISKQLIPAPDPKVAQKIFLNANNAVQLSKNTYSFITYIPKSDSYRIGYFEIK